MSNKIKVDTTKIGDYISKLDGIIQSANSLDSNLKWYAMSHGYNNVSWTLNNQGSPSDFVWRLRKNIDYLNDVSARANYVEQLLSSIDPLNYAESIAALQSSFSFKETLISAVSTAGLFGSVIGWADSLHQFVSEGDFGDLFEMVGSTFNVASDFIELIGDAVKIDDLTGIASFITEGDFVKKIFKLNPAEFVGDDLFSIVKNDFINEAFGKFVDVSDGVFKCVAEWAGAACDGAVTLFDNFKEFGEVTGRMVAETCTEFVTEILLDAGFHAIATGIAVGIATGVTAVVGAPVTVPALAISAGAFALSCAADWICEAVTGKDLTEFVSDTILDTIGVEDKPPEGAFSSDGGEGRRLRRSVEVDGEYYEDTVANGGRN